MSDNVEQSTVVKKAEKKPELKPWEYQVSKFMASQRPLLEEACDFAGIPLSTRQASKFRQGKGIARQAPSREQPLLEEKIRSKDLEIGKAKTTKILAWKELQTSQKELADAIGISPENLLELDPKNLGDLDTDEQKAAKGEMDKRNLIYGKASGELESRESEKEMLVKRLTWAKDLRRKIGC